MLSKIGVTPPVKKKKELIRTTVVLRRVGLRNDYPIPLIGIKLVTG